MKASYGWLKSLVPGLPDDPKKLAARFTAAGLEVEGIHTYGAGIETCVCAWVVSVRPHPQKSGLRLVTVDRGGATQEVVCGAPNVPEAGGVVVLAPLGTHLPAKGMTIERRTIAGVASEGMLCSEAELGLTEESGGILVLPPAFAEPGARFVDAVPAAQDTVFDIGLTPNRPDGLGHLGLAREAAALLEIPWKTPAPESSAREGGAPVGQRVKVRIDTPDRCPHYAAGIVEGATIAPSPLEVRYRLAALGVRPISNVVDVTNMVMLEYGHPMHAFDADKIAGGTIIVRLATEGEKLVTLDGETRTLTADDLVIADASGPVALAGVMGGASTEIGPSTKHILLECAYFDPRTVRRTARRHGLHSESSHRFERGVDHGDTRDALRQATAMTCRLGGGAAAPEPLLAEARRLPQPSVTLRARRMDALLGVHVPMADATALLERLGFQKKSGSEEAATFLVPTHRPDVAREADLAEEVVRVRGMDSVPTVLPAIRPTLPVGGREELVRRVRAAAVELGLSEAIPYAFSSPEALAAVGAPPPAVVLRNPLSSQQGVMRTSVLPGLLDVARLAKNRGEPGVALFTVGTVFLPPAGARRSPPRRIASRRCWSGSAPRTSAARRPWTSGMPRVSRRACSAASATPPRAWQRSPRTPGPGTCTPGELAPSRCRAPASACSAPSTRTSPTPGTSTACSSSSWTWPPWPPTLRPSHATFPSPATPRAAGIWPWWCGRTSPPGMSWPRRRRPPATSPPTSTSSTASPGRVSPPAASASRCGSSTGRKTAPSPTPRWTPATPRSWRRSRRPSARPCGPSPPPNATASSPL